MKAKKSLGQNFLIDNEVIEKIINEVSATNKDLIVEIGPGRGALTKKLKKKNAKILAYELDKDLSKVLTSLENDKTKVIYKDILESNIKEDIKNIEYENLYIVGNLPYYITTPIIEHIIQSKIKFKKFTIMIQREVADRFMAQPSTKSYGYITLVLKYYFNTTRVCEVSKNCFNPVPKVESTVLSFEERSNKPKVDEKSYFEFLKRAFHMKRKNLKNNLDGFCDLKIVEEVLKKYGYNLSIRAENLSEEVFVDIWNSLK